MKNYFYKIVENMNMKISYWKYLRIRLFEIFSSLILGKEQVTCKYCNRRIDDDAMFKHVYKFHNGTKLMEDFFRIYYSLARRKSYIQMNKQ